MSGRLAYLGGAGYPIHEVLQLAVDADRTWVRVQRTWNGAEWSTPSFPFYITIHTNRLREYAFGRGIEADLTSRSSHDTISY